MCSICRIGSESWFTFLFEMVRVALPALSGIILKRYDYLLPRHCLSWFYFWLLRSTFCLKCFFSQGMIDETLTLSFWWRCAHNIVHTRWAVDKREGLRSRTHFVVVSCGRRTGRWGTCTVTGCAWWQVRGTYSRITVGFCNSYKENQQVTFDLKRCILKDVLSVNDF